MTWRTVHEHIVADAFHSKKSLLALLVYEQQAPQKLCLSIHHSNVCGEYKINIYDNRNSVCKLSKLRMYICIYMYICNINLN